MQFNIEEELKKLPSKPGVYLMHDETDAIIYVGKAISLKNRVRQYFQSSRNKGPKIEQMVTHIARFEYIITDSELEALVLECNLIKEHRPNSIFMTEHGGIAVVMITPTPWPAKVRIMRYISVLVPISIPLVGSSKIIIFAFAAIHFPTMTFC